MDCGGASGQDAGRHCNGISLPWARHLEHLWFFFLNLCIRFPQVIGAGSVTSRAGAAAPAWAPSHHTFYGERCLDVADGLLKWWAPRHSSAVHHHRNHTETLNYRAHDHGLMQRQFRYVLVSSVPPPQTLWPSRSLRRVLFLVNLAYRVEYGSERSVAVGIRIAAAAHGILTPCVRLPCRREQVGQDRMICRSIWTRLWS